ncbi:MAG TPA: hypothetical protein VER36_12685, partial [Flavisolibacter sp.]|nr:hypothetical protein [Flavisolibacter sp.]
QYLYLHLTSFPGQAKFNRFLQQLETDANGAQIVISGFVAQLVKRTSSASIQLLQSLEGVQSYISSLGNQLN